jgi:hypothetical protein
MRVPSIATAVVVLKYPLIEFGMRCCCLIVDLEPATPELRNQETEKQIPFRGTALQIKIVESDMDDSF